MLACPREANVRVRTHRGDSPDGAGTALWGEPTGLPKDVLLYLDYFSYACAYKAKDEPD